RASEQDLEMPLDVCAFIGKEIASALDHAHRKRDNFGKPLGIVHRDVSPQNVLISYAGEVKLVDFGIAKATMKARQTAVGVIKGKYYYMSPEQAWGDAIDHRSDIFSAGIVLYEMMTGQMLYLEEDLHKLLDMARRADIAPPSKLRKGVPPQLEKIVMHALQKDPGERYQSAGDFATDLERFLHTYSPVFTAGKIASLIRQVLGDPVEIPVEHGIHSVEIRDGAMATHPIDRSEVAHADDRDELRDENSVIFRVAELAPPKPAPAAVAAKKPAAAKPQPLKRPTKPRQIHEETRQLVGVAPASPDDDSGLLTPQGKRVEPDGWGGDTHAGGDELEGIGERTVVSDIPGGAFAGGFLLDAGEDGVDATVVSDGPPRPDDTDVGHAAAPDDGHDTAEGLDDDELDDDDDDEDDGPTLARPVTPVRPRAAVAAKGRAAAPPPPALAAKIHAPAVSELRKPKASRKTPPGGVPSNLLQQIVSSQASEPMPVPREPPSFPNATPAGQPAVAYPPSTPPSGVPQQHVPGVPPHLQPYLHVQGVPYQAPSYPGYPVAQQPPNMGALYQMHSYPVQPASLTGQMRLLEVDEIPSHYKIASNRRRWFTYLVSGTLAIAVAAGATFLVMRATRDSTPATGSIVVESVPTGGEVYYDGTRLAGQTPMSIDDVPVGTRHEIRIELARHKTHTETVDVPKAGGKIPVKAALDPVTGKIVVNSRPGGAEIRINDQLRGVTPTTLNGIDMAAAKKLELRLKDYQPYVQDLTWPANGQIDLDITLQR
ncbi:MAG TPA: protein kinase, partial [Kofleriaceae bacterium]|nr:protein kinase [Kofleriaceae bacterium]